MSELRQAVAVLADYTRSDRMDVPDNLTAPADAYARACREVNLRLAGCEHLLKANQRSEAIRQAKLAPDLLDRYAELNFKGATRWVEITERVGLPVAPRLNVEAATRLNRAFADETKVAALLAQHRALALARAPLARRLDVVRLLARAEPANPGWQDDLKAYEDARFAELLREVNKPEVKGDREACARLLAEVATGPWAGPVPLDLFDAAQSAHDAHRATDARALLETQMPRLRKALTAGDNARQNALDGFPGAADALAAQVDEVERAADTLRATDAGFPPVPGFRAKELLAEAADWAKRAKKFLRKLRDFETAVGALDDYLKTGTEWYYVQEQYRLVRDFDLPIPPAVTARYAARAKSKKGLWLAAGGVVVAAAAAAAFFAFR